MERTVYERLGQLEERHWWFCARRQILASVIEQFAPKKDKLRILEAGCGTGGNLKLLSGYGDVDAFELDEQARTIASAKAPVEIREGRLPDGVPYEKSLFDVIAAFDVIEHVEQDVESLARLQDNLVPGGRLIMTVPAMPWLWSKHDETHHHYRRYTRKSLEKALLEAGYKPIRVSYFNTLLFPIVAGIRLVRNALGRNKHVDDKMPNAFTNAILKAIFGAESYFIGRVTMPVGVSLLAVAERTR